MLPSALNLLGACVAMMNCARPRSTRSRNRYKERELPLGRQRRFWLIDEEEPVVDAMLEEPVRPA